tara:strand:- start:86 stop:889 length:804 start_codon:yes stop_codon:yes gene_type:complete
MTRLPEPASRWPSATASPAVTRATVILAMLAKSRGLPISIGQMAASAKIPRSSAANICAALSDSGMVIETDHGFMLGPRLFEFGQAYVSALDPLRSFTKACQNLSPSMSETIQLASLDGLEVIYLGRHDGNQRIQIASSVGLRLPASCTALGKAMLADLPRDESAERLHAAEPLPSLTRYSKTTAAELELELEQIRHTRYAIDDQETTEGILCVGVAVSDIPQESGRFGVSITTLKSLATQARIEQLVKTATDLARAVSRPAGAVLG